MNISSNLIRLGMGGLALALISTACNSADEPDENVAEASSALRAKAVTPTPEPVFQYPSAEKSAASLLVKPNKRPGGVTLAASERLPFGPTFITGFSIDNNASVNFTTSNCTSGADSVLALFRRHDNEPWFSGQTGIQTLVVNDDGAGYPYSTLSYTNTSGRTENVFLMMFAWRDDVGQCDISGTSNHTAVNATAGSVVSAGSAGSAWTSDTDPPSNVGDPWLITLNYGSPGGDGNIGLDDFSYPSNRDSQITGNTNLYMWYVLHGWNYGTTIINN